MKVLLLQLPVQTHDFFYSKENVPLACAYLQLIGRKAGLDVEMVPAQIPRVAPLPVQFRSQRRMPTISCRNARFFISRDHILICTQRQVSPYP